ncbi:MAG TPA: hypothetical protein VF507_00310, partial [Pyrinomonadaceae bacterium]
GPYLQFFVRVINDTGGRILVTPATCALIIEKPAPRTLLSLDPEKVAKDVLKRGRFSGVLAAFFAGMATRRSTAVARDSQGNTATVVVTEPDRAAQRRADENARARAENNRARANAVLTESLKENTVFEGKEVNGWVFFEKKKYESGVFRILIPGNPSTVFEFPFEKSSKERF